MTRRRLSPRGRRYVTGAMLLAVSAVLVLGASSCEEELPPRNDPGHVFAGKIIPAYSILQLQNKVYLTVELINTYDETLQDTVDLTGTLEVTLLRDPSHTRTLAVSPANLSTTKYYDPYSRFLTVPSRDTVRLLLLWDMVDNAGVSLPAEVFSLYADSTCGGRLLGHPESFIVRGSVKVMKRTLTVTLPTRGFTLCYMSFLTTRCPIPITPCDPEGDGVTL